MTEDTVRTVARPLGLVGIEVCAADDTRSGSTLVLRPANRPR